MIVSLNVLITLTSSGKIFTVWSESVCGITGIDMTIGAGFTITDAVEDWFDRLPSYFFVDDENTVYKDHLKYKIKRPFMVEKAENPRVLKVS